MNRTHGCLCLFCAIPGGGDETGRDGCVPPRRGGLAGRLQRSGILAFPLQRSDPEALVQGRERMYFEHFWNNFAADKTRSIPEADRIAYAAYARPGRMRAGWAYFISFLQAAEDFAELARTRVTMPVLAIGGEKSLGEALARQMKLVASDVTVTVLKDTGPWLLEEQPQETTEALQKFL